MDFFKVFEEGIQKLQRREGAKEYINISSPLCVFAV